MIFDAKVILYFRTHKALQNFLLLYNIQLLHCCSRSLKRFGLFQHGFLYVVRIEGEALTDQFGGVERLEEGVVERGRLLRQAEGLVGAAFAVDIAEVGLAVESVVALRGEDKPAAVGRPRVVGVAHR